MDERDEGTEEPTPIPTEPLGSSLTRIDPSDQSAAGAKLMAERVKSWKQQLPLALSLVAPGQFVVMTQTKNGETTESIYATGGAADRVLRVGFGMRWGEKAITLEHDEEGEPVCEVSAPLYTQGGQIYEVFTGRRRMGGFIHNQADLIKGAIENMKHQAVTDLLGLRFLTPADLKEAGLDVSKLPRRAEFQDHGKDESGEPIVEWGKQKGTPLSQLSERDLAYLEEAAKKTLADASKSKFHKSEERRLRAYEAERKRRVEEAAKPATPKPVERISALLDAAKITEKAERGAAIKAATGKGRPSELVDDDVAKVEKHLAGLAAQKANAGKPEPEPEEPGAQG